jgi:hypothetical protein
LTDGSDKGLDGLLPDDAEFQELADDLNKETTDLSKKNSPIAKAAGGFKIDRRGR